MHLHPITRPSSNPSGTLASTNMYYKDPMSKIVILFARKKVDPSEALSSPWDIILEFMPEFQAGNCSCKPSEQFIIFADIFLTFLNYNLTVNAYRLNI